MKIAMLLESVSFGGGERVLERLALDLMERGERILIYSYRPEWKEYARKFGEQAEVRILSLRPTLRQKVASYREIRKELAADRPDALVTFDQTLAEVAVPAARSAGIPTLLSERCDPRHFPAKRIHRLWRNLITFPLATRIIFQTPEVRDWFSLRIRRRGIVIPNPILDRGLPDPLPASRRRKEIVSAGTLDIRKNHASLIRAFSRMKDKEWRLTIYGEGPERSNLESLIKSLGLEGRVTLAGKVARVVDLIGEAEIFVLPSRSEGMPNALIEGMAMGLASISTDFASGGARAIIRNGENGILVPVSPGPLPTAIPDPELEKELLQALDRLASDHSLRASIQQEAVKIRQTLSPAPIIERWHTILKEISR